MAAVRPCARSGTARTGRTPSETATRSELPEIPARAEPHRSCQEPGLPGPAGTRSALDSACPVIIDGRGKGLALESLTRWPAAFDVPPPQETPPQVTPRPRDQRRKDRKTAG